MRPARALLALPTVLLAGCFGGSAYARAAPELAALRANGYRVAVMPLQMTAPDEGLLTASLAPIGELLALEVASEGLPPRERVAELLRLDLVTWMARGDFEVIEPWASDTRLVHAGLSREQMQDPARASAVARLLQVDGVLYGEVTRWNRSYYVLQSEAEVGMRVALRDGADGHVLFDGERSDSVGAGLSGGPTGLLSAVSAPIAGLRGSMLRDLTRSVARSLATDLNGGSMQRDASRVPRLSVVSVARTHVGAFAPGERIEVVAIGSPDCEVRFDLGRLRLGVPMTQTERIEDPRGDRANYSGHYIVQAGDVGTDLPVGCSIRGVGQGRSTTARYVWDGSIDIDGAPRRADADRSTRGPPVAVRGR